MKHYFLDIERQFSVPSWYWMTTCAPYTVLSRILWSASQVKSMSTSVKKSRAVDGRWLTPLVKATPQSHLLNSSISRTRKATTFNLTTFASFINFVQSFSFQDSHPSKSINCEKRNEKPRFAFQRYKNGLISPVPLEKLADPISTTRTRSQERRSSTVARFSSSSSDEYNTTTCHHNTIHHFKHTTSYTKKFAAKHLITVCYGKIPVSWKC